MQFGRMMGRCVLTAATLVLVMPAAQATAGLRDKAHADPANAAADVDAPRTAQQQREVIEQRIGDAMHVDRFELHTLDVPAAAVRAPVQIDVELDDRQTALVLTPVSVRSPEFAIYSRRADGTLHREQPTAPATYRGHLVDDPQASVAATVRGRQVRAYIIDGPQLWIVEPVAKSVGLADRRVHVVYNGADVRPGNWTCGAVAEPMGAFPEQAPIAEGQGRGPGSCVALAEIAIDADVDYFELNNSSIAETQDDIETIINAMNLIYAFDVGITYEVITMVVHMDQMNDPFDTTSPGGILETFTDYRFNNPYPDGMGGDLMPDVSHLFTGKDLSGSVIGIAWLNGVCNPNISFGVSQSQFTSNMALRVQLTAHELGHNWSARHCNVDSDCAIMCSSVGGCTSITDAFGNRSREDIIAFRNSVTCLTDGAVDFAAAGQLTASDRADGDNFGISVAMANRTAIVGAFADDDKKIGDNVGAAYIYEFDGEQWNEQAKLVPMEVEAGDRLGFKVAIEAQGSRRLAAISAYLDTGMQNTSGSVYVYERQADGMWTMLQKIIADPKGAGDLFGTSVDIHNEFIIVGAPRDNPKGSDSGAAYIFRYDQVQQQWMQNEILTAGPEFGDPTDQYGASVAISSTSETGTIAAVSAWLDDESGNNAGSVYLYQYDPFMNEWNFMVKLCPAGDDDQFGTAIDLDGSTLAVGAPGDDEMSVDGGAVYVYDFDPALPGWVQTDRFTESTGDGDRLGASVAIDGSVIAAGAYFTDSNMLPDTGAIYLYRSNGATWSSLGQFLAEQPGANDQFGVSVGVSGDLGIAGAWKWDDSPILDPGAAYVFLVGAEPVDCNMNGVPDACDILTETAPDCNSNGVPDECDIADGVAQDLDGNGIPDECDTDCNDNGITDTTEIADGTATDCNGNNFPDECDIDPTDPDGDGMVSNDIDGNGVPDECAPDCNNNGIPDPVDVTDGQIPDCNNNLRPDSCELEQFSVFSGPLSPFGGSSPQSLVLSAANGVAPPLAEGDVTVTIAANADLNALNEYGFLLFDGDDIATLFLSGAEQCPLEAGLVPDIETEVIDMDDWNEALLGDGIIDLTIDAVNNVDDTQCADGFVSIAVVYSGGDCNDNGLLDICEVTDGAVADCNGNNVPDECEIDNGYVDDVNGNGIPDDCESCIGDLDGNFVVNVFDLLDLLSAWGPCVGCPEDFDGNDVVNVFDLLDLLSAWGPCS